MEPLGFVICGAICLVFAFFLPAGSREQEFLAEYFLLGVAASVSDTREGRESKGGDGN